MSFADRASVKEAIVLRLAQDYQRGVKTPTFKECWDNILWALDVLIQMLDTSPEERLRAINKRRKEGSMNKSSRGGLSIKFLCSINAIVGQPVR